LFFRFAAFRNRNPPAPGHFRDITGGLAMSAANLKNRNVYWWLPVLHSVLNQDTAARKEAGFHEQSAISLPHKPQMSHSCARIPMA
jgi:hypothetical protein